MTKLMNFAIIQARFEKIQLPKLLSLAIALVVLTPVALAALKLAARIVA
jgi:hypothetical protein